jgi:uncharacterized protein (TIGR02246 family)
LRNDIEYLVDRAAIIDLHSRLAAALDDLDVSRLSALFTPDVVVTGWHNEEWTGNAHAVERLAAMNASHHLGSHRMVTNHLIEIAGDRARATAHYRSAHLDAIPEPGQYGTTHTHEGWYRTELVRADGSWLIARLEHTSLADTLPKKSS